MNFIARFQQLNKSRSAYWLLVLRVVLGLALFFKGIQFIRNQELLSEVLFATEGIRRYEWLQILIPVLHLFGGLMILIGLFTRWASVFQFPIVLGAILFVKQDSRAYFSEMELPLAILVLLLLVVFMILGDGELSWKKLIQSERSIT
jgi:putative oxidoreductase